jgi:uncharacterized protein (TIGR03118 family)
VLEPLEERWLPSGGYAQVNLASDVPGLARITDANLVNPWGISFSPTGPFWFADNGSGVSDLLDGRGQPVPLHVAVEGQPLFSGTPTGIVFNGGAGFLVSEHGVSAPGRFLFAGEDGTISGWTAVVDWTHALLAVDNSTSGAVYKGLALATDPSGRSFLYAADFGLGTIDVFDQSFKPAARSGSFQDPDLPEGYAPFNIQNIRDQLFVTYAQRDETGRNDRAGAGHGFIDVYDTAGNLLRRFASEGALNSPWGLALAPASFGRFGGALLVGNNGDGHINAYDAASTAFLGTLADHNGIPITIPDLWALMFGNGHSGGASDTLFFSAGIDNEAHGLFGAIQAPARNGADTAGPGSFDPHAPGEPGDYPLPPSTNPAFLGLTESGRVTAVLLPLTESSLVLIPTLAVAGPRGRVEAPLPITLVGAVSFQASVGPVPPVARTAAASSPTADGPPPNRTLNDFLALNTFLDVNVLQKSAENPARDERLDSNSGAGETRYISLSARDAEAPMLDEQQIADKKGSRWVRPALEPSPPLCHAEKALVQFPPGGQPESAAEPRNEALQPHNGGSWTELLKGLLAVVSVPILCALARVPRARSLSHVRKTPKTGGAESEKAASNDRRRLRDLARRSGDAREICVARCR